MIMIKMIKKWLYLFLCVLWTIEICEKMYFVNCYNKYFLLIECKCYISMFFCFKLRVWLRVLVKMEKWGEVIYSMVWEIEVDSSKIFIIII